MLKSDLRIAHPGRSQRGILLLICVVVFALLTGASGGAQEKSSAAPATPQASTAATASPSAAAAPATQGRTVPAPGPTELAQNAPQAAPLPKKKTGATNPAQRTLQPGDEGAAVFREDNPGQRERWFYEQRAYPLGFIPFGIRQRAVAAREAMRSRERQLRMGSFAPSARTAAAGAAAPPIAPQTIPPSTTQWTPIGPQPVTSSFSSTIRQVSGRTSAVAVDPTNPNIVYVGGAQGGVWKSTDGGATWAPISDFEASLAIGAIAIDPANPQTIYVGTGEQTNSVGSYYGAGILKSTDGGASWQQLGQATFVGPFGTGFFPGGGARISSLAINPSNPQLILAGVQINTGLADAGVYCSNDGGVNWTQVLSGAMGTEVVYDPTPPGNLAYAALGRTAGDPQNGIYRSNNADQPCAMQTWTARNGTSPNVIPAGTAGRIEISIAQSSPNTLYASVAEAATGSDDLLGVFKTVDGGLNWSRQALSNPLVGPVGAQSTSTTCSPQCWYDHVIRVHPNNPSVVYLGGSASGFGAGNYLIRTTDGGTTWSPIATDGVDRLHVDIQSMGFAISGGSATRLYVGNDGGVWSTDISGGGTSTIDWVNHNGPATGSSMALGTLQYYPGHSIHPGNPDFTIGGTQDNGTHIYTGSLGWTETNVCGDGGYTAIDPSVPTTMYAACQNIDINKSVNSGANWANADTGITTSDSSAFIPPLIIDTNASVTPFARRQLYFGTFRIWRGDSDPLNSAAPTWTAISQDLNAGADVRAIAVSPNSSQIVWAGTAVGSIHRTLDATQLQTWQNAGGTAGMLPPRTVTSLAIDPHDPSSNTVYATFSGFTFGGDSLGHVFVTTNGGAAWTDITNNLPNTPVNDIVVDPQVPATLFIGTDVGVFMSSNGGASWFTLDPAPTQSLPTVAVLGLKLHRPSRLLRAGTHGRGMWDLTLTNFNSTFNLASMSPTSANAGDPNTVITVTGIGFSATSVVRFSGMALVTNTAGAPTQLTATIPAALLASGQTAQIDVFDPAQSPNTTNGLPFSVTNPTPTLTSINPTMAAPGGPGFTLTLNGTNFVGAIGGTPISQVHWNGAPRTLNATLVSNQQITVDIPASDIASPGLNQVTVFNSSPGGGTTAAQTFTVGTPPPNDNFANAIIINTNPFTDTQNNVAASTETNDPIPQVTTGCPAGFGFPNAAIGRSHTIWYRFTPAANVTVTVDTAGSDFDSVLSAWTGPALGALTQVGCDDDGVASAGASRLSNLALTAGTTYHFMVAGFSAGNAGTAVFNFSIPITISSITPNTAPAGSSTITLTVNGTSFGPTSTVQWNGTARATTFVSSIELQATIPASDLEIGAIAQVRVETSGQTTSSISFTIVNPAPTLVSVQPTLVTPAGPQFTLTLNGSGFVGTGGTPVSVVNWNGSPRTLNAMLNSASQMTVTIPSTDIASPAVVTITVFNPTPGGGTSAPQELLVATVPANDNFASASVISGNTFTDTVNNIAATPEAGDPAAPCTVGAGSNGNFYSIWYQFTPVSDMVVSASTDGSNYDTVLSAWTGAGPPLVNVACDDNSGLGIPGGGATSRLQNLSLTAGTNYRFMVGGFNATSRGTTQFNFTSVPDFNVSVNPSALTVSRGQSGTVTVTVIPLNGAFANAISLSCAGNPSQSACIFNPTSVTPGSNPATATLTITTTAPGMVPPASPLGIRWSPPPVAVLAMLLMVALLFAVTLSARAARRARAWQQCCFLLAIVILAGVFVSCGGGGGGGGGPAPPPPNPGTPIGTFNVTVRGTSGTTTRTATVALTVQ